MNVYLNELPEALRRGELGRWLRSWLCTNGFHWPIAWSDYAYPGSYDPPEPPEPGFACAWCGHEQLPYRAWYWRLKERLLNRVIYCHSK